MESKMYFGVIQEFGNYLESTAWNPGGTIQDLESKGHQDSFTLRARIDHFTVVA